MALARIREAEGNSPLARPRLRSRALAATGFVISFTSLAVGNDGWQWRMNKLDNGRLQLAFTEVEATDNLSGLSYSCKPASGVIEVSGATDKQQREVFADLIRTDVYPTLKLEEETAFWELSHSDVDGWEFRFEIAADGAAFDKFRKTGQFGFKVGTLAVDNGIRKAGLDKAAKFQTACKLPADKVRLRSKDPKGPEPFPESHAPVPWIGKP